MLFLLYIMVFVLEVLLVYVGGSLKVEQFFCIIGCPSVQPRLEGSWFGRCLLSTCPKSSSLFFLHERRVCRIRQQ